MIRFARLLDPRENSVRDLPLEEIENHLGKGEEHVLWLDVEDPTPEDAARLREWFGFHPLALEDCLKDHQRPKFEAYGDTLFFVCYRVAFDRAQGAMQTSELDLFLSRHFVVTLHQGAYPEAEGIINRWLNLDLPELDRSGGLFYFILDEVVDDYFPVIDELGDRLEFLEDLVFKSPEPRWFSRIFRIRKELSRLRRLVFPLREAVLLLMRHDHPVLVPQVRFHLQDVYDHLARITE
ncbi:MAG: magnesium transporter CorA family protein, partial [Bacteroidota bacterium]